MYRTLNIGEEFTAEVAEVAEVAKEIVLYSE